MIRGVIVRLGLRYTPLVCWTTTLALCSPTFSDHHGGESRCLRDCFRSTHTCISHSSYKKYAYTKLYIFDISIGQFRLLFAL